MTTPETAVITFGGTRVPYVIRRSSRRRKTVAVSVGPHGEVSLLAPENLPTATLDGVVRRKAKWILQRLRHAQGNGTPLSPREFVSGESVLYLGRHYRLKVDAGPDEPAKLRGGWLHVSTDVGHGRGAKVRASVVAWFRQQAHARLSERVALWQARAGVPMPRVVIADQQRRWGSCDTHGTVRLNWRVMQAPIRLVDYVVVHELLHLRHRGHGREYWRALGKVMPDYERRREDLRRLGTQFTW